MAAGATARRGAIVAVLLALAWAFLFLGNRPLADPDEGRYAEAAREMLVHRSWLVPLLGGRPHLTKPPPTYWLAAAGMALLGRNEWGARLGTGLAFAASILAAAALGRLLAGGDRRAGTLAGIGWATALLPFVGGSLLTTDPVLAAAEAAAVLAGARALLVPGASRRRDLRLAWAALGLAFFVKGPPGLLPLAGLAWAWPRRREPSPGERFLDPVGVALFVLLAGWWYVAVTLEDPARMRRFLVVEVYERLFTDRLRRSGPPWLPAAVLAAGTLPWGPFLLRGLPPRRRAGWLRDPRVRLLGGWGAASLLAFTASRSRMPLYVLPVSLAVVVPAAISFREWWAGRGRGARAVLLALLLAWAGGLLAMRAAGASLAPGRTARPIARRVAELRGPGEPVFLLDDRPWPGLMFYLDEEVPLLAARAADGPAGVPPAVLARRLRERGGSALVVVRHREGMARLAGTGLATEVLARVERPPCRVVRVRPEPVSR